MATKYYAEYTCTGNTLLMLEDVLSIDRANGYFAIGHSTSIPPISGYIAGANAKLNIADHVQASGSYVAIRISKGTGYGFTEFSQFYGASASNYGLVFNTNDLVVDKGASKIGIGITTPAEKLDVVGNIKATGNIKSTVATGTQPFTATSTTMCSNLNAQYLSGLTVSPSIWTSGSGGATWPCIPIIRNDGVMEVGRYIDFHLTSGDSGDLSVRMTSTASGALTIDNSTMTAGNFILNSDISLKTNIIPLDIDVDGIEFVEFEMKSNLGRKRYGVIAQNVEKIAPELVYEDVDGLKTVAYIDLLVAKVANLEKKIKSLQNDSSIEGSESTKKWQVDLYWNESTEAVKYEIWRSIDICGTYYLIGTSDINTYSDITLHKSKTYYYKILSYDIEGHKSALSSASRGIIVDGII